MIEQVDRAIWTCHGDTTQINAQLDLNKVESNLSERHSNVLSLVEEHWMVTVRPIRPVEVAEAMPDEFVDNGRQKALQALDALFSSGWWKRSNAQTANAAPLWSFNL